MSRLAIIEENFGEHPLALLMLATVAVEAGRALARAAFLTTALIVVHRIGSSHD